jgi:hypothetical protein
MAYRCQRLADLQGPGNNFVWPQGLEQNLVMLTCPDRQPEGIGRNDHGLRAVLRRFDERGQLWLDPGRR